MELYDFDFSFADITLVSKRNCVALVVFFLEFSKLLSIGIAEFFIHRSRL
jgi:hypothetical protein